MEKYIKDAVYYDRPVVIPQSWNDFITPQMTAPPDTHRGCLSSVRGAKEVCSVWADMGWADCSVEWLREQGCPESLLAHAVPNGWTVRVPKPGDSFPIGTFVSDGKRKGIVSEVEGYGDRVLVDFHNGRKISGYSRLPAKLKHISEADFYVYVKRNGYTAFAGHRMQVMRRHGLIIG